MDEQVDYKMASRKKTTAAAGSSKKNNSGKAGNVKKTGSRAAGSVSKPQNRSKKNTSAKRKAAAPREYVDYAISFEIFLWIIIGISVLLFISCLGFGGKIGQALRSFCFGIFGVMAWVFPFLLFFTTAFLISNYKSRIARIKAFGAVGIFLTFCGMMQLLLVGYDSTYHLDEYYEAGASFHTGGGFTGGALMSFFCPAIGIVGTWIVLFLLFIIFLILATQKSLFAGVKSGSRRALLRAREERALRKERRQQWEENHPQWNDEDPAWGREEEPDSLSESFSILPAKRRITRKVKGVTGNTSLPESSLAAKTTDAVQVLPTLTEENLGAPVFADDVLPKEARRPSLAKKTPEMRKPGFFTELDLNFDDIDEEPEKRSEPEAMDELRITLGRSRSEENAGEAPLVNSPADRVEDLPDRPVKDEENAPSSPRKKQHMDQKEVQDGIDDIAAQIRKEEAAVKPAYKFPPVSLMKKPDRGRSGTSADELRETAAKLQHVFETFGVNVKVTNVTCGPSVTRYELTPQMGVKVSKIVSLQDDIMLNLAAEDIRIEAPIPGKAAVGIEVPNRHSTGVLMREMLESQEFSSHRSKLAYAVGKDIAGKIIVSDIARMPHLLIAGSTGSGKSVFINTLIMSILYKASPEEVKMIMVDPKVVELSVYNGIPHLYIPVVTDPKKAAGALNWAVAEMMKRYQMFSEAGVRDLKSYNSRIDQLGDDIEQDKKPEKMPQILIIVDELADLMMVASAEVEDAIVRLTQLARAAGIHLVIATQRPSVDVITGLIKANMPSRIAFAVSSSTDSRTILDSGGAEKLLGNGDMLFSPQSFKQPLRVQGAYVSDEEVAAVVDYLKENNGSMLNEEQMQERMENVARSASAAAGGGSDTDELFAQAGRFIIEKDKASIGMLQRWFKIGFNRAARIMDQLADAGVVGPEEGTKPRKVLMNEEQFENYLQQN